MQARKYIAVARYVVKRPRDDQIELRKKPEQPSRPRRRWRARRSVRCGSCFLLGMEWRSSRRAVKCERRQRHGSRYSALDADAPDARFLVRIRLDLFLSGRRCGSRALARAAGVAVRWRPFLLGPIFKAQGWNTSPFNIYPDKGRYMWRDLERICGALGLPLQAAVGVSAEQHLWRRALRSIGSWRQAGARIFAARSTAPNSASGRNIGEPATIAGILGDLGQRCRKRCLQRAQAQENKARLRSANRGSAAARHFRRAELRHRRRRIVLGQRPAGSRARLGEASVRTAWLPPLAPAAGIAAGDQPIDQAEHHAGRGGDLGLARNRRRRMVDRFLVTTRQPAAVIAEQQDGGAGHRIDQQRADFEDLRRWRSGSPAAAGRRAGEAGAEEHQHPENARARPDRR